MESIPQSEPVRTQLIELLKIRGVHDKEAQQAFYNWARAQEYQVEQVGTPEARILYQIECADIYIDAGLIEEGRESLLDALTIAIQEGSRELSQKIENRLASL